MKPKTIALLSLLLLGYTTTTFASQSEIDAIETAFIQSQVEKLNQYQDDYSGYSKALVNYRLGIVNNLHGDAAASSHSIEYPQSFTRTNSNSIKLV